MPSLRRITALLVSLLLVQLLLGDAGAFGAAGRAESPGVHAVHAEHAEHAASAASASHEHDRSHLPGCPDCESPAGSSPCDAPWAPGACSTMPTCAVALAAAVPAPVLLAVTSPGVDPVTATAPPGPAIPPELPPPRA
ncbi:MAG TPA: hypothetical protein VFZ11_14940 [Gemmatimonadaceae bacterium]